MAADHFDRRLSVAIPHGYSDSNSYVYANAYGYADANSHGYSNRNVYSNP
jgi:hypothetical protein